MNYFAWLVLADYSICRWELLYLQLANCYNVIQMANKRKKPAKKSELTRIGEYMISGGVWFWSGYVIIITLDDVVGLFWANFIGNAVGISLNFLLERYWVFRKNRPATVVVAAWRYVV